MSLVAKEPICLYDHLKRHDLQKSNPATELPEKAEFRMEQMSEAIACYDQLLAQEAFRDLAWAEELQERMMRDRLLDAGHLLAPVLRPQFISSAQLAKLTAGCERLVPILDQVKTMVLHSPALLNRLHLLPAEKMLASIPVPHATGSTACDVDAHFSNGGVSVSGLEACKPAGFAHTELVADLFLDLPIIKAFERGRYRLEKVGSANRLVEALLDTARKSGVGRTPNVAVLEAADPAGEGLSEGQWLVSGLAARDVPALLVTPENLQYSRPVLRSGSFQIDVLFRRLRTSELLARYDLSHPLLQAYRDQSVCVINDFQAEILGRRTLFELLSDSAVIANFSPCERELISELIPWTRFVSQRKTVFEGKPVDLLPFILAERERLVLRPNESSNGHPVFIGAEMSQREWERSTRMALQVPYVVQERRDPGRQRIPFFMHGDLRMREAEVCLRPHLFGGKLRGASASIEAGFSGTLACCASAPVFLLEPN